MSWNDSGQDPWSKPGSSDRKNGKENNSSGQNQQPNQNQNNDNPPDLLEELTKFFNKLSQGGGQGSKGSANTTNSAKGFGKLVIFAAIAAVIIWIASGFYTIKEAERGVVLRFGKLEKIVQPGLNWKPTFIDTVLPVNVERISELKTQGSMLTQDENMVTVEMTVQYRIQDPANYLFHVVDPQDSLSQATDSALRYVIGHMSMDDILTTGRSVVRERTWKSLNEIIKPYNMGLEILDVNFQSARPPEEVKDAFDDAIKAQEDEQRLIREAEAYAREREPIARGNAQQIIEQATAYKEQIVLDAKGETERFTKLIPEFKANPQLLKERLYLESMEKVMAKTPKVLLDNNGNNLTVLPLEQLMKKGKTTSSEISTSNNGNEAPKNTLDMPKVPNNTQVKEPTIDADRQGRF
ncbi:FtsH protease activity modulator HflK [Gallibacterium salpingitidis]|uniref:FtsH protease activity modulator HflK n=1 Tax=Gallibacterium salpingitidis TaxID=505341 RepID=UPI00266EAE24|nr:FtsH protease activity modulator HflK [Gallibacterium salpingitidis]WKT00233.1 FtsH protease activity modulator HflK [Gallibacterium salpingitidis]